MAPEPETPSDQTHDPSRAVRFFWWFGTYLTGFLITLGSLWQPGMAERDGLLFLRFVFIYAPIGLIQFFSYVTGDPGGDKALGTLISLLAFAFYPLLLIFTLVFRSPWKFLWLMVLLVAALVISWIGDIRVDGWRFTRSNGFHQLSPEQIERLKNSPAQK